MTRLLDAWRQGQPGALDEVLPLVYEELRGIAVRHMQREPGGHALQPTALVHEVYLKLVGMGRLRLESRQHFLSLSGRLMRQILVDQARRRQARKRGNSVTVTGADVDRATVPPAYVDLLALDEALNALAVVDPRQCQLVELRYFAGLTIDECASALDVSTATIEREWAVAKAWLFARLSGGTAGHR